MFKKQDELGSSFYYSFSGASVVEVRLEVPIGSGLHDTI